MEPEGKIKQNITLNFHFPEDILKKSMSRKNWFI